MSYEILLPNLSGDSRLFIEAIYYEEFPGRTWKETFAGDYDELYIFNGRVRQRLLLFDVKGLSGVYIVIFEFECNAIGVWNGVILDGYC